MVCCPQGSSNNPFTYHHISSQASSSSQKKIACGQPLFNNIKQGGNGGLGSHPWVARIGYISKQVICYQSMPSVCIFNNSKIKRFENLSVYVEILKLLILYLCKNCNQIHMLNTMILQFIFDASLIIHLTYQHIKTPIIHQNILVSLKKKLMLLFPSQIIIL